MICIYSTYTFSSPDEQLLKDLGNLDGIEIEIFSSEVGYTTDI